MSLDRTDYDRIVSNMVADYNTYLREQILCYDRKDWGRLKVETTHNLFAPKDRAETYTRVKLGPKPKWWEREKRRQQRKQREALERLLS